MNKATYKKNIESYPESVGAVRNRSLKDDDVTKTSNIIQYLIN
ncbi:hypothetical protein [Mycoplasmopsis cynos]|nr:hypothetical protein [Mycoplasmopsis cynos]